jgi:DNA replication protein DnaC
MAACAIRASCKKCRSAIYVKAFDFFLSIRSTYAKETATKTEQDVLAEFSSPSLLVIDAIENRSDSPFENMLLNHLIDTRYDALKDTILIGNIDEAAFAASMGPSIVDRIHECGVKIVCNWKSFR